MTLKNSVIFIEDKKQDSEKPVQFTHVLAPDKGMKENNNPTYDGNDFDRVVYLGVGAKGQMFACYHENGIGIYIGHLNSGKY